MKALMLYFFTSLLFLFLSSAPIVSPRRFPTSPPVVDVDGKELKLGAAYYVISQALPHPEGLCLVNVQNNQSSAHPHDVVQCTPFPDEPLLGFPVVFSAAADDTEDPVVRENTVYNVKFPVKGNRSNETAVWALTEAHSPIQKFVTTDPKGTKVQFQAQRVGFGYKMIYCVVIPIPRIPICYAIGLIPDFGYNRLGIGLGLEPAQFFFKSSEAKANSSVNHVATS
ncbi:unnamed protein product [Cuscuta campestris]|uniref:Uncharacterized protein n=1 Tax=Cuscuta campestris TaxID=132261 RepID=A0A484MVG5_9ASTE|nr:unnamed protein product [Cuscuta campestris]